MNATTGAVISSDKRSPMRFVSLARRTSRPSPSWIPESRRSAWPRRPYEVPALIGSPRPMTIKTPSPRAPKILRMSSCRRRDLPTPGGAFTSTARGSSSSMHPESNASSMPSSASRPTQGVGLPSSGRVASSASSSPVSTWAPEGVFSMTKRTSSSPRVASSIMIREGPGPPA